MRYAMRFTSFAVMFAAMLALPLSCNTTKPIERPNPIVIVDEDSRKLAHDVERDRILEELQRAENEERVAAMHLRTKIDNAVYAAGWALIIGGMLLFIASMIWLKTMDKSIPIWVFAAGLCFISFSMAVSKFGESLALIAIITLCFVLLSVIVYAVYVTVFSLRAKKANTEMVEANEKLKTILPEEINTRMFGNESDSIAKNVFSPTTRTIVKKIRAKIGQPEKDQVK